MSHLNEERLHRYMDGDLSELETRTAARHLEECAACRARFHEMRPLDETTADDHPDPMLLAAFHDGTLGETAARAIEHHTDSCGECRDAIAFLAADAKSDAAPSVVPDEARTRAGSMLPAPAETRGGFFRARNAWAGLAAAAALVLMVGYWQSDRAGPALRDGGLPERFDRALTISPSGETRFAPGEPVSFQWKGVEGALTYEVEVTGPDGGLVASAKTTDTNAAIAIPAPLASSYGWRLTAVLRDGSRVVSEYESFTPATE